MPALLFIIGLVCLFFFTTAIVVLRSSGKGWRRLAISIPCTALGLLALTVLVCLAWEHYTPLPSAVFVVQLQSCADQTDRPAVFAKLASLGFTPILHEQPFPEDATAYSIAPADAARAASYLALRTPRVRPHDLMAEYLDAVFLFDSQQRLITWSYVIASPNL